MKIYLTTLLFITTILSWAQELPLSLIERANSVQFIFEGEIINSKSYYTNNNQFIRTSNTVQITKILKGDIECGTIEIITDGGTVNNERLEISHNLSLGSGEIGIFLCDLTDRPVSVIDFYPELNPEKLQASFENQSFIRYWWNGTQFNAADMWLNFDSLAVAYNLTENITGLSFIDCYQGSLSPIDSFANENSKKLSEKNISFKKSTNGISSFSPSIMSAGTGDTLTILGSGFGNNHGAIRFVNSKNSTTPDVIFDDFILWKDDSIQLVLPSYIEQNQPSGITPGTGYFEIETDLLDTYTSPSKLTIKFAVKNSSFQKPVIIAPWSSMNKKFTFICDTAVANYDNGEMKKVIQKAIDDWICLTGVNWVLSNSDTIYPSNIKKNDKSCVIFFKEYPLNKKGTLATTSSNYIKTLNSVTLDSTYLKAEIDLSINKEKTWFCDTTQSLQIFPSNEYDFYTVILHELGHAMGLRHIIDTTKVMHASTDSLRRITKLTHNCVEGGNWIINYTNDANNQVYDNNYTKMEFNNNKPCSQNIEIQESFVDYSIKIDVFPNPCEYNLSINYSGNNDNIKYNILDINGRVIKKNYIYNKTINVEDLNKGVYIIRFYESNKLLGVTKFVKN